MTMLQPGDTLPVLAIPIAASDIVAMSIATRDFHPVHHDATVAQAAGHPALFINIMTTAGLVERFLLQAAGRQARLVSLKLRLGLPHYAGETLTLSGRVTAQGENWSDVEFEASNPRGRHAAGQARLIGP